MKKILMTNYRRIFGKKCFYKFNKFLFNLSARGMGIGNCLGENNLFKYFYKKELEQDPIIVDVGAGRGAYLEQILKIRPTAKIYAFEPNPSSYEKLNNDWGKQIKTYKIGLGNKKENVLLYDLPNKQNSGAASIYSEVFDTIHKKSSNKISIEIDTLDNMLSKSINNISLLKIDTEGNELAVLQGAPNLLKNTNFIQFEFNSMNVCSRVFFKDFYQLLSDFHIHRILTDSILKIDKYDPITCEIFGEQNFLAINKKLFKSTIHFKK